MAGATIKFFIIAILIVFAIILTYFITKQPPISSTVDLSLLK